MAGAGAGLVTALPALDSVLVTVAATTAASLAITLLALRTRAGNEPQRSLKLYNHGEGAFTFKNLLRSFHYAKLVLTHGK